MKIIDYILFMLVSTYLSFKFMNPLWSMLVFIVTALVGVFLAQNKHEDNQKQDN